ncbi:monocarboxylate transporter [Elysia marginata]|uniref:Monocarboxylate transporter n=1 Tax=Elysia marginata TaxID=1093978 RepID=A0AAV4IQK3_9GAST|nr:monocarboxylate transporter [Elysia marginata]
MATENGVLIRKHPQRPPPPQDTGWSWMIVLGVFIYAFFMVGIAKSYGLFLLEFVKHFGVTVAVASMPLSISGIVYAFGAPAALIISEKYDAQRVVIFGAIFGMVGIAISSALVSMGFVTFFFGVWYGK